MHVLFGDGSVITSHTCGQKQYVPDSYLWQFRRANKLATQAVKARI